MFDQAWGMESGCMQATYSPVLKLYDLGVIRKHLTGCLLHQNAVYRNCRGVFGSSQVLLSHCEPEKMTVAVCWKPTVAVPHGNICSRESLM